MAIVVDKASLGTLSQTSTSGTIVLSTSQAVASGGFIVVVVGWFDSSFTLSSVGGGGLSWSIDKQAGTAANGCSAIVSAQAPSGLASATSITATYSGSAPARCIGATSFTGVATSNPVDGTPLGPTSVATAAWSTGSYTIAAGSVICASCFNAGPITGNTETSPSVEAWQSIDGTDAYGLVHEYRIESAAAGYTVAGAWNTTGANANISVAYLAAATSSVSNEAALRTAHTPVTWRT